MTGEKREPKKNKPRKEKARVNGGRELTKKRKDASDRLFVLEIDLSLDESSDEPRVYALELLSAKLKRRIHPKKSFILSRVTAHIFPPIKTKGSPPFDLYHAVECGKHKAARI